MDRVRQLILDQAKQREGGLRGLSLAIGRSHSYLQQFINRGIPLELPEKVRGRLAVILEMPESQLRANPNHHSRSSDRNMPIPSGVNPTREPTLEKIPITDLVGDADLPVYATAQGGRAGALIVENDPFTHTTRPRRLAGKKRAYGILIIGNSMAREYNEGDIAFVDPHQPPRKGDPCVFQSTADDGTVHGLIKYLERSVDASETLYYVSQTNPAKKFTLKKAEWQKCHVLVGKESGL